MLKTFLIICSVLAASSTMSAGPRGKDNQCRSPNYKVAVVYSQTAKISALAISIRPRDVTVGNLLALACQLRADYPGMEEVGADIFNDEDAARHTIIHGIESPKGSNEAAYIASYYFNQLKKIEILTLAVDPNHPCGNDIQIDIKTHAVSLDSCK